MLLVYQGWTGVVGDETYDVDRVWGKVNPAPGVEEDSRLVVGRVGSSATIVRGTLLIPTEDGNQQSVTGALIDVSGREVRELHPGQNSTAGLAPGVYFVRGVPTHDTHKVLVVE